MSELQTPWSATAKSVHAVLDQHILVDGFDIVLDLRASHGSWIVDARDGHEYLDLYTNFASLPVGHNHPAMRDPEFLEALTTAAIANPANSDIYTPEFAAFVKTFAEKATPEYLPHLFFVAGGANAVENALKCAFDWKTRMNHNHGRGIRADKVIAFAGAFHGRTGYAMSLSSAKPIHQEFFPLFDWPKIETPAIVWPLAEHLTEIQAAEERALKDIVRLATTYGPERFAAVIVEPVQGEGGDRHFRPEFMQGLRKLCDEFGMLLIFDEIQTGFGLTGSFWCHEQHGVLPDILTFGKKAQVCGVMAGPRLGEAGENVFTVSGKINSTWGGNLVDMVRCVQYLRIIEEENLVANAAAVGAYLRDGIAAMAKRKPSAGIRQVRGAGLMIAFDLPDSAARGAVLGGLKERSVLALSSGAAGIRLRPPLNLSRAEADFFLRKLEESLS